MVSVTGISSGVHTASSPVMVGSDSMSSIQSVCDRISPTRTSPLTAWGAASCPTMWPVAGASTTTMSQLPPRTSQQSFPTVMISRTPGAAVARKSNALATGPIRPTTGTCNWSLRYSRSDASVSIVMAKSPGWTSFSLKEVGGDS